MPQRYQCTHCQGTFDPIVLGLDFKCPLRHRVNLIADGAARETLCRDPLQEGSLKRNFLKSQARIPNFVPKTHRGNFDATLNMTSLRLELTVNVYCDFVAEGGGITNWWGPLEKSGFKEEFQQSVNEFWNNKGRLSCTRRGWTDIVVTPEFKVNFQDQRQKANFVANINRDFEAYGPGGLLKCNGAFVGLQQITSMNPQAQSGATFQAFNPRTVQLGVTRSTVARRERERIEAILNNRGPIAFAANSAQPDPAALLALAKLASEILTRRTPNAPRVPLILTGDIGPGENAALAQQRASAVRQWLVTQGHLDNPATAVAAHPSNALSRVVLTCDATFDDTVPDWNYNISAHEFGHLIGLPDEYEDVQGLADPLTNPKRVQRLGFDALVLAARVAAPQFGSAKTTTSIMSYGADILPCHMVTAWEALGKLSMPFLTDADWRISVV